MTAMQVVLFGQMDLRVLDARVPEFPTAKSRALFAMLLLQRGRPLVREKLIEILWPDAGIERGRKCLSTELWRIRDTLNAGGIDPAAYVITNRETLTFSHDADVTLDVAQFEDAIAAGRTLIPNGCGAIASQHLETAVALYRGDLLEGIYDAWCELPRANLRNQYLFALETLLVLYRERGAYDAAIECARKLLVLDPLLEHIHRDAMICYFLKGNRPAAIQQYRTCAGLLREELAIDPMPETKRVLQLIADAAFNGIGGPAATKPG
jgi:DNA-binding SARP family transcriptional activator